MSRFTRNRAKRKQAQAEIAQHGEDFTSKMEFIAKHPQEYLASSWKQIWQLPLRQDKYSDYVWSNNGQMALSSFKDEWELDRELIGKIVRIINGDIPSDFPAEWSADGCDIYFQHQYAFCVRGWGHLTGFGGLYLDAETAALIQDGFVEHIVNKLNNNQYEQSEM